METPFLLGTEIQLYEFLIDLSDIWFGLVFIKEVKRPITAPSKVYFTGVFINNLVV